MKKRSFCIIPLIMVLMGCAGEAKVMANSAKPVERAVNPASPAKPSESPVRMTESNNPAGMDLDAAIKEAAVQMGENLPGGTKVALVSVASTSVQLSEYVISRLEAALVNGKKLVVMDRANLDKVREEQGFQLSGEVDDNSAKSIGKLLGAGAIVTGAFSDLGDVYSLTLKAINIETATVAVSYPVEIIKSTRIETLLASGGGAGTRTQAAQTGGNAPQVVQPAASAVPSSPVQISEEDLVGVWKGSYRAGQGETALILSVYKESGKYMAIFDFYNLPGRSNSREGKYYMDVSYNRAREKFYLKGITWIERPSGYSFADLEGTITGDVFNGFLSGSNNTFRVVKDRTGTNYP
jgi:hypothetical protein